MERHSWIYQQNVFVVVCVAESMTAYAVMNLRLVLALSRLFSAGVENSPT